MEHKKPKRPTPSGPKAFDVFRPGKVQPHANSRPVIVSNRPEQADPMVKEAKEEPKAPAQEAMPSTAPEVPANELPKDIVQEQAQISALAEAAVEAAKVEKPEPVTANEDDDAEPAIDSEGQQVKIEAHTTPDAPEAVAPEEDVDERQIEQEPERATQPQNRPSEPQNEAQQPEARVHEDEAKELLSWEGIESAATHAPTVSIHHHRPSKAKRFMKGLLVFLLFLGFALIALDIVLDAGMWIPNYELPHTHIIQHYRDSRVVE